MGDLNSIVNKHTRIAIPFYRRFLLSFSYFKSSYYALNRRTPSDVLPKYASIHHISIKIVYIKIILIFYYQHPSQQTTQQNTRSLCRAQHTAMKSLMRYNVVNILTLFAKVQVNFIKLLLIDIYFIFANILCMSSKNISHNSL